MERLGKYYVENNVVYELKQHSSLDNHGAGWMWPEYKRVGVRFHNANNTDLIVFDNER